MLKCSLGLEGKSLDKTVRRRLDPGILRHWRPIWGLQVDRAMGTLH
jgi:hypothetical protein